MSTRLLFFDLEFTCREDSLRTNWSDPLFPPEVIQIGLVLYDFQMDRELFARNYVVRPGLNETLTEYCKNLTGLSQIQINKAPLLGVVNDKIVKDLAAIDFELSCSWGIEDLMFWKRNAVAIDSNCPLDQKNYVDLMRFAANELQLTSHDCQREQVRLKLGIKEENTMRHDALSDARDLISLYRKICLN